MRLALLPPLCALVSLGCAKAPAPDAADGGSPAPIPASAAASSGTDRAAEARAETGPCAGKAAGALVCDGEKVARCAGPGGEAKVERACFDIERCDAGACVPACPEGEVYIPATGPEGFTMGRKLSTFGFGSRKSGNGGKGVADMPHRVVLTRPFCMMATEVTVRQMKKCAEEKGCRAPLRMDRWVTYPDKLDHPVNLSDWKMSKYYCEQYGSSLPTEAQWEWAATGGDGRDWPWGNEEPSCERADFTAGILISPGGDSGCHGGGPSKVATHTKGDRIWPTGAIHDLAGNVWEWVLDSYKPYSGEDEVDPMHDAADLGIRVVRGGGWNRSGRGIMAAFRGGAIWTYKVPGLGFRCVRNAKER
jgi:formylglycine-generating enzyme required for sulfatase activity